MGNFAENLNLGNRVRPPLFAARLFATRCGGLAKMPDIRSAEILRFCTISRNTCSSENACFDTDTEPKFCLWIQIIALILTINWLWFR